MFYNIYITYQKIRENSFYSLGRNQIIIYISETRDFILQQNC
jgi:hypothetical protein